MRRLNASNLKKTLWETLLGVKAGLVNCNDADAISKTAKEILRTTATQLKVSSQTSRAVPIDVITFSENRKPTNGMKRLKSSNAPIQIQGQTVTEP